MNWMYRAADGKVMCGPMWLPNVETALKLPFRIQSSGDLAGAPAVRLDFYRVQGMRAGMPAVGYWEYEALVLKPADIEALKSMEAANAV